MAIQFLQNTNINGTFQVKDSGGANELLVSDGLIRVYSTLQLDSDILASASYGTTGQVLTSNGSGSAVTWETLTDLQGVTSVSAGNGMNFTTITGTGPVTMGTPGTLTSATTNGVTATSHTHNITTGIANTNIVKINSTTVATGEYARFTTTGLESRTAAEVATDIGAITGVTAGTGMTGGGSSGTVTLNVIGGTGITANADDVAITYVGSGNAILAATDSSGTTLFTGAKIWFSDDGTIAHANVSDLPFTNTAGTITGITPGTNLNGGGTSGGVTINLDNDITINTVEYTYPTAINQYRGEIVYFGTFPTASGSNGTIAAGDVIVYTSAGLSAGWIRAQGIIAYGKGMLGVAMGTTPAAGILIKGFARNAVFTSGGLGSVLYLSPTSAGDTTITIPSASNNIVRIVGYMLNPTNDEIFFDPDKSWVQIA